MMTPIDALLRTHAGDVLIRARKSARTGRIDYKLDDNFEVRGVTGEYLVNHLEGLLGWRKVPDEVRWFATGKP